MGPLGGKTGDDAGTVLGILGTVLGTVFRSAGTLGTMGTMRDDASPPICSQGQNTPMGAAW